jgi:hypothetical protein
VLVHAARLELGPQPSKNLQEALARA